MSEQGFWSAIAEAGTLPPGDSERAALLDQAEAELAELEAAAAAATETD